MENTSAQDNGRIVAIVCYVTLIGWIVALIIHSTNKSRLGAYHLRQMLGLMILVVAVVILGYILNMIPVLGGIIGLALDIGLLVLWLFGLVAAINGQEKPLPIVGGMFKKWFAGFAI